MKVRVGYSPLTGQVYIYRHGRDPGLALEKREALQEVMVAAGQHMLHGITPGDGAINDLTLSDVDGNDVECVILVMPKEAFNRKFGEATQSSPCATLG